MAQVAARTDRPRQIVAMAGEAAGAAASLLADATFAVRGRLASDGTLSSRAIDREQRAAHGLAWLATYVEAVRQLATYAERLDGARRFGEREGLLARSGSGGSLAQMRGGIPISRGEMVRPADLWPTAAQVVAGVTPAVEELIASGNSAANRARLIELMRARHGATVGDCGL